MSREARHAQLVAVGLKLLETTPFHALSMDDVADRVGISRSLVFHYFPTKQAFLTEVVRQASAHVLAITEVPQGIRPDDRPRAMVSALVRYIRRRRDNYVAVIRSAPAVDPALEAIISDMRDTLCRRMLREHRIDDPTAAELIVSRGVLAAIEEVSLMRGAEAPTTDAAVAGALLAFSTVRSPDLLGALTAGLPAVPDD